MHSLIHYRLSTKFFNQLLQYVSFLCEYLSERVRFESVIAVCFSKDIISYQF